MKSEDISSKYEMTIIMEGEGTLQLFNNYFKIIPSYINVDGYDVQANGIFIYNLHKMNIILLQ